GVRTLVTWSHSSVVAQVLTLSHAAGQSPVVMVAEGRPGFEGRRLAVALADAGLRVTLMTDAAAIAAASTCDMALVGADAVTPSFIVNKFGWSARAGVAQVGVRPFYVLPGMAKLLPDGLARFLRFSQGAPAEIWPGADGRVSLHNPYFEKVPF